MSPILISVIVVLVVVFGTAFWIDLKRRRLGDTNTGGVMGKARRQVQLDSKERGSRWGAGG
jgi:signal transduction histidine kinase